MKNLQCVLFPGSSEMAERMRAIDGSSTDLGPPSAWPENLRIAVRICLRWRFPILLWWGRRYNMLYNASAWSRPHRRCDCRCECARGRTAA